MGESQNRSTDVVLQGRKQYLQQHPDHSNESEEEIIFMPWTFLHSRWNECITQCQGHKINLRGELLG